ncbi:MAG TPA: M20/M25/M40 family metallo-hydrolase [Thermomicrobiales bacterium]|nr:M20/M25/M40 family metallo-hydrolase [Thermomicrobiales bacterium]
MPIEAAALPDLLSRLVAIDSTNPDLVPGAPGEGEIARFVAQWLERAGLDVTIEEAAPGRPNVVGVVRGSGGGRSLMLNAHTDTVGAGGMEQPWTPRIDGDRLFGRGAFDMKGSLAAIMLVAAEARRANLRGDLIVTAVCDEEYASIGTQAVVERWRADAAIVTEPTDLDLVIAHKGFIWYAVETRGVAAHGSLPDEGVDAIAKMGPVLLGVQALDQGLREREHHPLLGAPAIHASLIAGGQELSSYPASCRLEIERRTLPGETAELAARQLELLLDGVGRADAAFDAKLTTMLARNPFAIDPNAEIVQMVRRHAAAVIGREPALIGQGGWMDSSLLDAAGIPCVIFGPTGDGAPPARCCSP